VPPAQISFTTLLKILDSKHKKLLVSGKIGEKHRALRQSKGLRTQDINFLNNLTAGTRAIDTAKLECIATALLKSIRYGLAQSYWAINLN